VRLANTLQQNADTYCTLNPHRSITLLCPGISIHAVSAVLHHHPHPRPQLPRARRVPSRPGRRSVFERELSSASNAQRVPSLRVANNSAVVCVCVQRVFPPIKISDNLPLHPTRFQPKVEFTSPADHTLRPAADNSSSPFSNPSSRL
jgi:hypothetical protein